MTGSGAPRLSVVILTLNEEAALPETLRSLAGLPAQLFVVDSGSTDRTLEIAARAGAAVVSHPFANYAAQRNWAQDNLPLGTEWVLHLDAGERPTPELIREISAAVADPPASVNGFLICRRTIFWGRWIKHGAHYP
ncbi:MAG: glycosyltransferase family 2 protein, partial [Acidobacteriota bacterium]